MANKIYIIIIFILVPYFGFAQGKLPEKYGYIEQMPEAPYDLLKYLSAHIRYPKDAWDEGITGKVHIRFIVTEKGVIDSPWIAKPVYPSLDSEALRVIQAMPPWRPGKKDGKSVRMFFTLPVYFRPE